jgi:single-strand DNA-binding protein
VASEYLHKGSKIFIEGEIDYQEWEKDGEKKYRTVIQVREMKMLGGAKNKSTQEKETKGQIVDHDGFDDFIPFN